MKKMRVKVNPIKIGLIPSLIMFFFFFLLFFEEINRIISGDVTPLPILLLMFLGSLSLLAVVFDDPLYIEISEQGLLLQYVRKRRFIPWDKISDLGFEPGGLWLKQFVIRVNGEKLPIIIGGKIENGGRDIIMAYERYVSGKRPIVNSEKGCGRVGHML